MTATATAPVLAPELGADLSPVMAALEDAYKLIQSRWTDAPDVTIIIKRDSRAWGHTTVAHAWGAHGSTELDRYEVMISGENLARGPIHVAATLLHEAAHARNLSRGIKDCDSNGRHTLKFASAARELGLTVTERGWRGSAQTELSPEGFGQWTELVDIISAGMAASATAAPHPMNPGAAATGGTVIVVPPVTVKPKRNKNLPKAVCGCGYSIRASQTVLDSAKPACEECGEMFTVR